MPKPLSNEWIAAQLALCEKATPGPWEEYGTGVITYTHPSRDICELGEAWGSYVQRMNNAELIAAAREGYPMVLKELQGLRRRRCANCGYYAYYDGPLCGLNDVTEVGFLFPRDPDTWYCADWKPEEAADASSD